MPVYLLTIHAYRSWSEDNPAGDVQRDEGLKPPNPRLAKHRRDRAAFPPFRFDSDQQRLAHDLLPLITAEYELRLHAASTTRTHVHTLASFRSPACTCGATKRCDASVKPASSQPPRVYCRKTCPARKHAEQFLTRLKRKLGQQLAAGANTKGRPYLSRGWDITPSHSRPHFDHLMAEYLPKHESEQAGIFKHYP